MYNFYIYFFLALGSVYFVIAIINLITYFRF